MYLNNADVRRALHVEPESAIGRWRICSNKLRYNVTQPSLLPDYKNVLIPNIRVLIFNGDVVGVPGCALFILLTLPWPGRVRAVHQQRVLDVLAEPARENAVASLGSEQSGL